MHFAFQRAGISSSVACDPARIAAACRRVDAYPGYTWWGRIESFSPASGAKYSLIPPEPAAGNFTKVVQRVPVKITIDETADAPELAVGLSALVEVHVD